MEIEDKVQLTYVAKITIQNLYKVMNDIQYNELIVFLLDAADKIERCISKAKSARG